MTTIFYVPPTEETDQKKINQSIQLIGGAAATATDNIATNTTNIATLNGYLPASGQVAFPATQNPSAGANTLDDYEEGTWTPTLTFATPGNLSVVYSLQSAYYTKIGRLVSANFVVATSTFTYTTASGTMQITGLPFPAVNDANYRAFAPLDFQGINKASYQAVIGVLLGNTSNILIFANGMGQTAAAVATADSPTTSSVVLGGVMNYVTAT